MAEQKVWIVTRSSRGLGRAIAEEMLQRGDVVVATARKTSDLQDLVEKGAFTRTGALRHTRYALDLANDPDAAT